MKPSPDYTMPFRQHGTIASLCLCHQLWPAEIMTYLTKLQFSNRLGSRQHVHECRRDTWCRSVSKVTQDDLQLSYPITAKFSRSISSIMSIWRPALILGVNSSNNFFLLTLTLQAHIGVLNHLSAAGFGFSLCFKAHLVNFKTLQILTITAFYL